VRFRGSNKERQLSAGPILSLQLPSLLATADELNAVAKRFGAAAGDVQVFLARGHSARAADGKPVTCSRPTAWLRLLTIATQPGRTNGYDKCRDASVLARASLDNDKGT
jgi:hypothetical protein